MNIKELSDIQSRCLCICRAGAVIVALSVSSCGGNSPGSSALEAPAVLPGDPLMVSLAVDSSDLDGDALVHEWQVTAGSLSSNAGRTVNWTLPEGGGLQFAYLTVSDHRGGYVERTFAVELGSANGPPIVTDPRTSMYSVPARDSYGAAFRGTMSVLREFGASRAQRMVYLPAEPIRLTGLSLEIAAFNGLGISDATNLYGEVRLPRLPAGTWGLSGTGLSGFEIKPTVQNLSMTLQPADDLLYRIHGHVSLQDGALCGLISEYKRKAITPTVTYGDLRASVNAFGDYALRIPLGSPLPSSLTVTCESMVVQAPVPVNVLSAGNTPVEVSVSLSNHVPTVSNIRGSVNGVSVGPAQGDDVSTPSDAVPRADHFLTYKGTDSADSACAYYLAIGATPSCGANGAIPSTAIRFDEWKRMRKLAPYDTAAPELHATYVNKVDLNLTRDMHAVKNNSQDFAFYVCNYPVATSKGLNSADPTANALAHKNLVACVAMDFSVTPGSNNDKPFTKFYVFGPAGNLIPSVNLDGRGEKYIPGSCVICHGGEGYLGKFPRTTFPVTVASNGPTASIGARFLPFDVANYSFSGTVGLRKADQQLAFKQLNFVVRDIESAITGSNVAGSAAMSLIDGWYASNRNRSASSDLNEAYVPDGWQVGGNLANARGFVQSAATAPDFYRQVVAKSCRTCHVALPNFDWDTKRPTGGAHVCGGTPSVGLNAKMANSKVTFDQFWLSVQQSSNFRGLVGTHLGCNEAGVGIFAPFPDPAFSSR